MTTLPFNKKSILHITLQSGEKIFAKVTRFDPVSGKVSWKDLDEHWKGSLHVSRVVVADPQLVKDWEASKQSQIAPMPTVMSRWSFGKTKRGPAMMEGHYYEAPILLDGKKVGLVVDEGYGGPIDEHISDPNIRKQFNNDINTLRAAYPEFREMLSHLWSWWEDDRNKGITFDECYRKFEEMMAQYKA